MTAFPPTGHEISQIMQALFDAFTLDGLRQMLRTQLDVNLENLVPTLGQNGDQIAHNLVRVYAAEPGGLALLLRAALAENPGNPMLQNIAAEFAEKDFAVLPLPNDSGNRPLYVNVPALPPHFLGREALLSDLARRLCAGQTPALSADGLPGVGKTTLAIACYGKFAESAPSTGCLSDRPRHCPGPQ